MKNKYSKLIEQSVQNNKCNMKTLPQQIREEADNFKFLPRGIQLNFNNGNTVFTIKKECWMYQYDNWYLLDYENNQVFAYKGKCKIS